MSDACSVCGVTANDRPALILLTHEVRGKRRMVTWTECVPCHLKAEREMEEARRQRQLREEEESAA